jgi:hypothetical protein
MTLYGDLLEIYCPARCSPNFIGAVRIGEQY